MAENGGDLSRVFNEIIRPFKEQQENRIKECGFEQICLSDLEYFEDEIESIKEYIENILKPLPSAEIFDLSSFRDAALEGHEGKRNLANYIKRVENLYKKEYVKKVNKLLKVLSGFKAYYCYLACLQCNVLKRSDIVTGINSIGKAEFMCKKYVDNLNIFKRCLSQPYDYSKGL